MCFDKTRLVTGFSVYENDESDEEVDEIEYDDKEYDDVQYDDTEYVDKEHDDVEYDDKEHDDVEYDDNVKYDEIEYDNTEYEDVKYDELEYNEINYEQNVTNNCEYYCDACDRSFSNHFQLQHHLQEHIVCGIDGCKFVAHAKIVEKHIDMQHVTGLYYRIAQSDSPEDIAKWIAERKKRYPTKENIEKRQKEQEEMMNRGERIQLPGRRFGKNFKKVPNHKPNNKYDKRNQWQKRRNQVSHCSIPRKRRRKISNKKTPVSLINDRSTWNGDLPPFQGTSELYEDETDSEIEDEIDNSEWISQESSVQKIEFNNALGALIGAYRSSDESDDEIIVPKWDAPSSSKVEPKTNESNENVLEEGEIIDDEDDRKVKNEKPSVDNKVVSKKKRSRNKRHVHKKIKKHIPKKKFTIRRITLLERLLASDIKHERNVILQCVRYVIQNNFFMNIKNNINNEISQEITENIGCNNSSTESSSALPENTFMSDASSLVDNTPTEENYSECPVKVEAVCNALT